MHFFYLFFQAGLYNKWEAQMVDLVRRQSRIERLKQMKKKQNQGELKEEEEGDSNGSANPTKALTIVHMQGPLLLFLISMVFSSLVFVAEVIWASAVRKESY